MIESKYKEGDVLYPTINTEMATYAEAVSESIQEKKEEDDSYSININLNDVHMMDKLRSFFIKEYLEHISIQRNESGELFLLDCESGAKCSLQVGYNSINPE